MVTDLDSMVFKPEWMRPPSWRWSVSEEYLADPYKDPDYIKNDSYLRELVDFKRFVKCNLDDPGRYWKKYPDMATAYNIFLSNVSEGGRWLIEAYLMTSMSDGEIADRLKIDGMKEGVIARYRKIFFDIDSYRNSEAAVTANLLATSKVKSTDTGISDFTWKLFSYVWGARAFEMMFFPHKGDIPDTYKQWLREKSSNMMDVYSFHTTRRLKDMYNENVIDVINTAKDYWELDSDTGDWGKESRQLFLDDLSRHAHIHILGSKPKKDYSETFNPEEAKVFDKNN